MRGLLLTCVILGLVGCGASERVIDPDLLYGHRYEDRTDDGRQTLVLEPPAEGEDVFSYPAVVDNVRMRVSDPDSLGLRRMDIRFHGSLPDACIRLHRIKEEYIGRIIYLTFEMLRPKGASCQQVVRRYRFYHELSRPLEPGAHNLIINGTSYPFELDDPFRESP